MMKSQPDHRLRRSVAALIAIGLMAPATVAAAKPGNEPAAGRERQVEAAGMRPAGRPAAQVDKVYRGPLTGAIGIHTWSGDIFGTGVDTVVTYEIALDEAGVPGIVDVVVDESTLPAGAAYEVRGAANRVSETPGEQPSEDRELPEKVDDTPPVEEVSLAVAEDGEVSSTAVDDSRSESEAQNTVTFAARNGVRFSLGERWAGLLLLAHGRLGDEPAIAVRTVLVSPPAERPSRDTTTPTVAPGIDEKGDRHGGSSDDRSRDERRERYDRRGDDRPRHELADRRGDLGDDHQKRDDHRRDRPDHQRPPADS